MSGHLKEDLAGPSLEWWNSDVLAAANIMPATGLATDYLNVFNEAIMLFGLLPDMPELYDELETWEPLTYEQHFSRSGFQAKDLAILAYQNAAVEVKQPFDELSHDIGRLLHHAIIDARTLISNKPALLLFVCETSRTLQSSLSKLDGMVHGGIVGGAQDDIDALFD